MAQDGRLSRRAVVAGGAAAPAAAQAQVRRSPPERLIPAQTSWSPPPAQAPETAGPVDIGSGVKLFTRDTGGRGEPVIFMHAATGSAHSWAYQQPVMARAGYRFIAFSRRGHRGSPVPDSATDNGTGAGDVDALADALKLGRFHLVATAAGGFIGVDYAIWKPERLASLTLACTLGGIRSPEAEATRAMLQPKPFSELPAHVREMGPSYRAGYPEGVERWIEIEHAALIKGRVNQGFKNRVTLEMLAHIRTPTLIFTGDADMFQPPSTMRKFADQVPGSERAVVAEAGHSAFWEQPEAFNALVLGHLRKHRARG